MNTRIIEGDINLICHPSSTSYTSYLVLLGGLLAIIFYVTYKKC